MVTKEDAAQDIRWSATLEGVDTVVLAVGAKPNKALPEELKGLGVEVHAIGDCVQPGFAIDAIYAGAKIAREI